jgi:hypothetical protein
MMSLGFDDYFHDNCQNYMMTMEAIAMTTTAAIERTVSKQCGPPSLGPGVVVSGTKKKNNCLSQNKYIFFFI